MMETVILGAGIAGLAYAEKQKRGNAIIYEQKDFCGGLCHSFEVNGFTFDSAVHLSFTNNPTVRMQFDKIPYITHTPLAYNFYEGYWLGHPVVNNLYPLDMEDKIRFLSGFFHRPLDLKIQNYKDWLLAS